MNYMPQKERSQRKANKLNLRDRLSNAGGSAQDTTTAPAQQEPTAIPRANAQQEAVAISKPAPPATIKRRYLIVGALMLAASIVGMMNLPSNPSPETGQAATDALESGSSRTLQVGARLASNDSETNMEPTDYTVEGTANGDTTKLYIWDYAGEDGDYVQVIVDGEPISEEFMIMHKPREFDVPTSGTVQVKGIHDAGGGLTYAAHYDLNGESYFNNAPEGVLNTYTIAGN